MGLWPVFTTERPSIGAAVAPQEPPSHGVDCLTRTQQDDIAQHQFGWRPERASDEILRPARSQAGRLGDPRLSHLQDHSAPRWEEAGAACSLDTEKTLVSAQLDVVYRLHFFQLVILNWGSEWGGRCRNDSSCLLYFWLWFWLLFAPVSFTLIFHLFRQVFCCFFTGYWPPAQLVRYLFRTCFCTLLFACDLCTECVKSLIVSNRYISLIWPCTWHYCKDGATKRLNRKFGQSDDK